MMKDVASWVEIILGGAGALALFIAGFRGNLNGDTIKLMRDNKAAQDDAIKRLQENDKDKDRQISNLAGQVQMMKDIPLAQIAKSLEVVTKTHVDMQVFLADHDTKLQGIADSAAAKVIDYIQSKEIK